MISWRDEVGMATLELNGALDNHATSEQALEHLQEAQRHVNNAVEELEGRIR
jgi:hypothetical protein